MKVKNIYVVCPANHKTGGTELAHQLVALYNKNGKIAQIAYTNVIEGKDPINPAFKKYVDSWISVEDLLDDYGTLVFLPEIQVDLIPKFKRATIVFWWMSVDFFIDKCGFWGTARHFGFLKALNRLRFTKQFKDKTYLVRKADLHAYQSEYARQYIKKEEYGASLPLSDYINDIYLNNSFDRDNRENIVLYNPKKGFKFTNKLMKAFPNFEWVALENMSNEEVQNAMSRSKVYIDFGNHPGKDRFPREAAMSGCCIITGLRGAAGNDIDISIPSKYKFRESKSNFNSIANTISYCLENYQLAINDYSEYREKIKVEKDKFEKQACDIINEIENMPAKG